MSHSFNLDECGDYIEGVAKGDTELAQKIRKALLNAQPKTVEDVERVAHGVIEDHCKEADEAFIKGLHRPLRTG